MPNMKVLTIKLTAGNGNDKIALSRLNPKIMKTLEACNIKKSFDDRMVVNDVSVTVSAGEIIGLLGPNGAGKTTTFSVILGLHSPDSGAIRLNGEDITAYPVFIRARMGITFLPQEPSVFKGLTVRQNIQAIIDMHRDRAHSCDSYMAEMGLTELADRKAFMLSGGERRRLEIARSLVLHPDFLLLDEPFAGIDPIQINEIKGLIGRLRERGIGIIITDHNVREILAITNRSYIINRGRVIFSGVPADLIADEQVKTEYLGREFRWH
jgi:lipopolysaccharide export system ATP-binding protein